MTENDFSEIGLTAAEFAAFKANRPGLANDQANVDASSNLLLHFDLSQGLYLTCLTCFMSLQCIHKLNMSIRMAMGSERGTHHLTARNDRLIFDFLYA